MGRFHKLDFSPPPLFFITNLLNHLIHLDLKDIVLLMQLNIANHNRKKIINIEFYKNLYYKEITPQSTVECLIAQLLVLALVLVLLFYDFSLYGSCICGGTNQSQD